MSLIFNANQKRMKKVLIVGEFTFPSGTAAGVRMANFSRGFISAGCRVDVVPLGGVSGDLPEPSEFLKVSNPQATKWRLKNASWISRIRWLISTYIGTLVCLLRYLFDSSGERPSVVILYGRSLMKLGPWLAYAKIAGARTALDLVECQDSFDGKWGKLSPVYWDWRMGQVMMRWVDLVSCISSELRKYATSRGARRTLLVPAIGSTQVREGGQSAFSALRILYVGALVSKDAPEVLVGAFRQLSKVEAGFTLVIAGRYMQSESGRRHVEALRSIESLRGRLEFHDSPSDGDLRQIVSGCDILMLPRRRSYVEQCSFPTRTVEFLQSGKVIAATDWGDIGHYLRDGFDAILFPPDSPSHMAEALTPYILNPQLLAPIRANAGNSLRLHFNRDTYCQQILSALA